MYFETTVCFIDLGKLNLLIILLPWSKSVKQAVARFLAFYVGSTFQKITPHSIKSANTKWQQITRAVRIAKYIWWLFN
jgi:hypothetical protein